MKVTNVKRIENDSKCITIREDSDNEIEIRCVTDYDETGAAYIFFTVEEAKAVSKGINEILKSV